MSCGSHHALPLGSPAISFQKQAEVLPALSPVDLVARKLNFLPQGRGPKVTLRPEGPPPPTPTLAASSPLTSDQAQPGFPLHVMFPLTCNSTTLPGPMKPWPAWQASPKRTPVALTEPPGHPKSLPLRSHGGKGHWSLSFIPHLTTPLSDANTDGGAAVQVKRGPCPHAAEINR